MAESPFKLSDGQIDGEAINNCLESLMEHPITDGILKDLSTDADTENINASQSNQQSDTNFNPISTSISTPICSANIQPAAEDRDVIARAEIRKARNRTSAAASRRRMRERTKNLQATAIQLETRNLFLENINPRIRYENSLLEQENQSLLYNSTPPNDEDFNAYNSS